MTAALGRLSGLAARELADTLVRIGLNERAVCACFGVRSVLHASLRAAELEPPPMLPPAAVAPWLLVGGHPVPLAVARSRLAAGFDLLLEAGLIAIDGDRAVARLRLLPVGESVAVCGDGSPGSGRVPDDSTGHLLGALPSRRIDRWLDLGTGNAVVPLARRGLARQVLGTDVDDRALELGAAGIALSGAGEIELARSDLWSDIDAATRWDLITFNAPIPGDDHEIFTRFWREAGDRLAPGGEVIAHTAVPAGEPPGELGGQAVIARYTPPTSKPGFAVTIWRPADRPARRLVQVSLSREAPHVRRATLPI